jgi:hypothetical protein
MSNLLEYQLRSPSVEKSFRLCSNCVFANESGVHLNLRSKLAL